MFSINALLRFALYQKSMFKQNRTNWMQSIVRSYFFFLLLNLFHLRNSAKAMVLCSDITAQRLVFCEHMHLFWLKTSAIVWTVLQGWWVLPSHKTHLTFSKKQINKTNYFHDNCTRKIYILNFIGSLFLHLPLRYATVKISWWKRDKKK